MAKEEDTEKYKVKLLGLVLYCPIGIMSDRLTTEIFAKWEHTPIKYYFNRTVVKSLTMPISKAEFLSDNLFPESEAPTRVFIMIVESAAYLGKYSKSPFAFKRKWTVAAKSIDILECKLTYENSDLRSTLEEMRGQIRLLVDSFTRNEKKKRKQFEEDEEEEYEEDSEEESLSAKRTRHSKNDGNLKKNSPSKVEKKNLRIRSPKNREKNVAPKDNEKRENVAGPSGLVGRLMNAVNPFAEEIQLDDVMSDRQSNIGSIMSEPSPRSERIEVGATQDYWITNIELELMSSPLDQLSSKGTEEDAMPDYVRLQKCLNQFNQVISSGISYDQFLKSAFIAGFDLTTNQQPGLAYAINTVRTGEKIKLKNPNYFLFLNF